MKQVRTNELNTLLYVLTRHPTEPHTFVWVERYRDEEPFEARDSAPYLTDAKSQLPELLAVPPNLLKLTQVLPS